MLAVIINKAKQISLHVTWWEIMM